MLNFKLKTSIVISDVIACDVLFKHHGFTSGGQIRDSTNEKLLGVESFLFPLLFLSKKMHGSQKLLFITEKSTSTGFIEGIYLLV